MKSLFINTATRKTVIAIVVDYKIQYFYNEYNIEDLSTNLMPIIDEAFKKVNMKPKDIDTLFVTNGPGSFTGIRIGLTVAKLMAWCLKIKVIPISSLELMASTKTDKKYIAPIMDAKRNHVFAGLYDSNLNPIMDDSFVLLEDFQKEVNNKDVFYVSHDKFDFEIKEAEYDILKIIDKHKKDDGINPHKLNPNYLKNIEAEELVNKGR